MKEEDEEEYLVLEFKPMKVPKNKILKWLFWNVYWQVWKIWRPTFLAWFYGGIADWIEKRIPEEVKEDENNKS